MTLKEAFRRIVIAPVIAGLLLGGLILGQITCNTPDYKTTYQGGQQ